MSFKLQDQESNNIDRKLSILFDIDLQTHKEKPQYFAGLDIYIDEGSYCIGKYENNTLTIIEWGYLDSFLKHFPSLYTKYNLTSGYIDIPKSWLPIISKFPNVKVCPRLTKSFKNKIIEQTTLLSESNTLLVDSSCNGVGILDTHIVVGLMVYAYLQNREGRL